MAVGSKEVRSTCPQEHWLWAGLRCWGCWAGAQFGDRSDRVEVLGGEKWLWLRGHRSRLKDGRNHSVA